jgi:hypothetical protein
VNSAPATASRSAPRPVECSAANTHNTPGLVS